MPSIAPPPSGIPVVTDLHYHYLDVVWATYIEQLYQKIKELESRIEALEP